MTKPVRRLTGTVLFLLALAISLSLIAVRGIQQASRPLPLPALLTRPATESAATYGDKYCYAGQPRATPAFTGTILVLTNTGYVVGYSERLKDPVWVCYRLFRVDSLQAPPRPEKFAVDSRTTARASSGDYTGSGYDRGHMAPNFGIAVCYGRDAQIETFLMSNIIPQRPKLNRQVWENLESTEIRDYTRRYNTIWVTTGPVFSSSPKRLKSGIAVPEKCYKIIARENSGRPEITAFLIPQDVTGQENPGQFAASVREIEKTTGLDFFCELPADLQDKLESGVHSE